jgi:uncharacterized membrane protein
VNTPDDSPESPQMEPHLAAFFAVLVPPFSSALFLKIDSGRPLVRFYATQSLAFGCAILLGYGLLYGFALLLRGNPELGAALTMGVGALFVTVWLILWVVQLVAAISGREWEMPVFGAIARRIINRAS